MARRTIDVSGDRWLVEPSGRVTQYSKDEFGVLFTRGTGTDAERRVVRFSPRGSKSREEALARLTDQELKELLAVSQPSWTSPDTGYAR